MTLTWIDWIFVGVLAITMLAGFMRGLVQEGLGLATWVLALVAARFFAEPVADMLDGLIDSPDGRLVLAFVLVTFVVIMLGGIVIRLLHAAVEWVGMGFFNRIAGAVFGTLKGAVILVLATLLIGFTPLEQLDAWQNAEVRPTFERLEAWGLDRVAAWERKDPERAEQLRSLTLPDILGQDAPARDKAPAREDGAL
ncbi:membrane protein required for colicin V production [Onishia taeanensis]|jgi:membrane protein required for colicin V production|uniref:Membrane protein required for colicin V production n=1 Tax=Onishia taeanensis TaxID=284577 RepID=A0A1G7UQB3_9GAMM|nr:CvpA family protein [Halomonas taeanensis]MAX31824.1 colicin V production protein [Halomonadaceae bacterium]SDG49704.1 membrane protein required for colicin V production [Halomonas taeanensis]